MKLPVLLLLLCFFSVQARSSVFFEQPVYKVVESGGQITITVVSDEPLDVAVDYATADDTASAESDYSPVAGTLSFGRRGGRQVFTIPILDDDQFEGDETVELILQRSNRRVDTAQLIILDDESRVSFSTTNYTVAESDGTATITLRRLGTGTAGSVNYAASSGTATSGSDFTAVSGTATFPIGVDTATFTVPITPDGTRGTNETVLLTLTDPVSMTLATPSNSIITILNDSPGVLDLRFNAEPGAALPGSFLSPLVVSILPDAQGRFYVGGRFTQFAGQQRQNIVRLLPNGSLDPSFLVTNSWASSNNYVVGILPRNDGSMALLGGFTVFTSGGNISNGALLQTNGTITSLGGNTFPDQISAFAPLPDGGFAAVENTFNQNRFARFSADGARLWTISPPGSSSYKNVTDGGSNRVLFSYEGNVRRALANGAVDAGFTASANGPVTAMLQQPDGKILLAGLFDSVNGVPRSGMARLNNDGSLDMSFDVGSGPDTKYVTSLISSKGKVLLGGTFGAVDGTIRPGIARLHNDGSLDFGFDPGSGLQTPNTRIVYSMVPTAENGLYVGGGFFSYDGVPRHSILRLWEGATAGFASSKQSVYETNGTINLTIENPKGLPFTMDCITVASNAVSGSDFVELNQTFTFASGETNKTISVTLLDDNQGENNESFFVVLTNASNGLGFGNPRLQITIRDDDSSFEFGTNSFAVVENGTNATVSVVRVGLNGTAASVTYITSDGTANTGEDYTAQVGTLNFAPGETQKTFSIPIQWDTLVEGDESVNLVLSSPVGATLGSSGSATLTIKDFVHFIRFATNSYQVSEGDTNVAVTIERVGVNSNSTTVVYSTANNGAVAGSDYQASAAQLTFAPGETMKTILVPVIADTIVETNEQFRISLSNPGAGTLIGSPSNTFVTIIDDDAVFHFEAGLTFNGTAATLRLETPAGSHYAIDGSTNLIDWQPLGTNAGEQSIWSFSDTNAGLFRERFYRARKVAP